MKRETCAQLFRRLIGSVVLLAYLASCTHLPSGQKAFDSFEQCIAGNLGLAAAGGVAVGALGKALVKQVTGDRNTQNAVGVTAGVAAAVMIGLTAWRKCAAVYNTSEPIAQSASAPPPPPLPAAAERRSPGLNLSRLEVRVEGSENDPPIPEFDFAYVAADAAAKDIKARFRHKVEIVRFKADDNDKLILADAKGDTLRDSAGKTIPLEAAVRMPRDRLHWVTIADDGKDDYVEDVIIQQGQRASYRHKLQIPPRAQLPLPLPVPMRYSVTVEVDLFKSALAVDFTLLNTGERPKRFAAAVAASVVERATAISPPAPAPAPVAPAPKAEERKAAAAASPPARVPAAPVPRVDERKAAPATKLPEAVAVAPAARPPVAAPAVPGPRAEVPKAPPAVAPSASIPAAPEPRPAESRAPPAVAAQGFAATHTLRRDTLIHNAASLDARSTGRLTRNSSVQIVEPAGFNVTNRPRDWVRIVTQTGLSGWLQAGELEEIR